MKTHAKQLFWNAMLLSAASLLMRTVGVGFQVYVSGRAGSEAMGLFSLLMGVYGFLLTLATSGIHLGVTRVVVDAIGKRKPQRILPAMKRATVYALFFGILSALLLFLGAEVIGIRWLGDARTVPSLKLLSATLPLIALSSAWGGYFTAVRRPYKNAAVQVLEQGFKIGITVCLFGTVFARDVQSTCLALVAGGAAAEILSFVLSFLLYRLDRHRHFGVQDNDRGTKEGRMLLGISLPIAFTAYIRSGLITLQHVLIPLALRKSGSTHTASLIAYGCIQGMALPVILYPAALISSFSGLLVPELAEAEIRSGKRRICYMVTRVWSLSMIFSIGAAGLLITFSGELGMLLYPNTDAGYYIRVLAPLIPIMYVDTATDAMMKGLGEQVFSMKINIADALISVIFVSLLIPKMGIRGYIVTVYVSELFNTVCSVTHLLTVTKPAVRLLKWVYKPLICIVCATALTRFLLSATKHTFGSSALTLILFSVVLLLLYGLLLCLSGTLDREDRGWICALVKNKSG